MKKSTLVAFLLLATGTPAFSQSWSAIVGNKTVYISGEGRGETVQEADRAALDAVISQIKVDLSSTFIIEDEELAANDNIDSRSYINSKIETYSEATLTNATQIIIKDEPDAVVGRYIKRSELDKIFEGRKRKINEYINLGMEAEERAKLDDALRMYYWAFLLTKSLQNPNEFTDKNDHLASVWLPQHINDIFSDIKITPIRRDGSTVIAEFTFRGRPVTSLDFQFNDGKGWTNLYSVKDGRGTFDLIPGIDISKVTGRYEYMYRGQTHIDHEVETVLKVIKTKLMRKCYFDVNLNGKKTSLPKKIQQDSDLQKHTAQNLNTNLQSATEAQSKDVKKTLDAVVAAIKSRRYGEVNSYFTAEGQKMFNSLIHYGNACVLDYDNVSVTQYGSRLVARSIPMSFKFERGVRKSFVEDIVFTFNANGKIESLAFGLDADVTDTIASKSVWDAMSKQVLISFLENYKTAYALKRADYLESIFDDNAIIIVGSMTKKLEKKHDVADYSTNTYVKRTQYTKKQYIQNLKNCFKQNEFVNLRFSRCTVKKGGPKMGETYGIQLRQDYYSTHYGDSGYLYVQVDLNNADKPVIHVRTWQEEPDPELGRVYGLEDF